MKKLPTLDDMIGITDLPLTQSQRMDVRSVANHRGFDEALEVAKKFFVKLPVSGQVCNHEWNYKILHDHRAADCCPKCGCIRLQTLH